MNGDLGHVGGGAEDVEENERGDGGEGEGDPDPIDAFGWGVEMGVAVGAEGGGFGDLIAALAAVADVGGFGIDGVTDGEEHDGKGHGAKDGQGQDGRAG